MRFDCDKWKRARKARFLKRLDAAQEWHRVFVVYQKVAPGDCRVLEFIERRLVKEWPIRQFHTSDLFNPYGCEFYNWEYRAVEAL